MPRYQLPCACGRTLLVSPAQAGEQVRCECGVETTVPKLRELRQLPSVADDDAPRRPTPGAAPPPDWSRSRGSLFSSGLLLAVAALLLGYLPLRTWLAVDTRRPPPPDLTAEFQRIDYATPEELYAGFREFEEHGLNRFGPPPHQQARRFAQFLLVMLVLAGSALVAGVGLMIAGLRRPPAGPAP